ncbi:hypothetical protein [Mycolicibacterium sp. HK-90]|uniref:hypothetical protein n=1 Tax=Mycolicibacterium sp. HK-90 TaxID=3056937 RepID=UPI002659CDB6|nr:hypothetical protein [Mycolicibacterium sp. HK-90]WKG04667.1 hypothetical protein QU592_06060 [Mycolicibacterium sp. HK-90]
MNDIPFDAEPGSHGVGVRLIDRYRPTSEEAVAELEAAWDAVSAAGAAVPARRWWRKRQYIEALHAFDEANRRFERAFSGVARARVGSNPHQWGLLSDNVESTLDHCLDGDISHGLRSRLKAIRDKVFDARIAAHTGDRDLEAELTRALASCLDLEPCDERARRLVHHLPAWARPIPDVDLDAAAQTLTRQGFVRFAERYFHYMEPAWFCADTRFQLRTFTVSLSAVDTLELHDIIVTELRGDSRPTCSPGLGTAALRHLCRTADHYGLSVNLMIMPGDRTENSAARLAGWYSRHGFEIRQATPGSFLAAKGHRTPNRCSPI